MASTVWKGYIAFGLVSIPVRLFAAARDERVSFNQIHEPCSSRIKQQLYCPTCDRTVERSEIKRGYPIAKEEYVLVEDEEIKKIAPASSETMEIKQFVKMDEIDPIYFDASYYCVPEEPGRRAYQLLLSAMERMKYVALAQVGMHQREFTVVIRPYAGGLTLHTMYYENEVRKVTEYSDLGSSDVKPAELAMAEKLIEALAQPFEPAAFHDEFQKKLLELVESKAEGRTVQATSTTRKAPVIDLMEALQSSLQGVRETGTSDDAATRKRVARSAKAKTEGENVTPIRRKAAQ
ncbi:MAG TPA: Ku protein [Bryobacteraceae bacterium]|jgi:DNA end-binding protein Ku|nr:Ku protein [Bryobacteraceae bacterium]